MTQTTLRGQLAKLLLLVVVLVIAGCGGGGSSTGSDDRVYFVGYDGVEVSFDEGSPPSQFYFYPPDEDILNAADYLQSVVANDGRFNTNFLIETGLDQNLFDISMNVHNKGAAVSRGGLYISGFDPNLLMVENTNIRDRTSLTDCGLIYEGHFEEALGHIFQGQFTCGPLSAGISPWGNLFVDGAVDLGNFPIIGGIFRGQTVSVTGAASANDIQNADFGSWEGAGDFLQRQFRVTFDNPLYNAIQALRGEWPGAVAFVLFPYDFALNFGQPYELRGDNKNYPGGEQTFISRRAHVPATWPRHLEQSEQTFMITNCYLYTTYATPVVCIDPEPFSKEKKVCTPQPITYTKGQGAPVAITRVEQENTPRRVFFTIHIENKGNGDIINPGSLYRCSPYSPGRMTPNDIDRVFLIDIHVSGNRLGSEELRQLDCTPSDRYIRLQGGKGSIRCSYEIEFQTGSAYQTPLIMELTYGYRSTLQKSVKILNTQI